MDAKTETQPCALGGKLGVNNPAPCIVPGQRSLRQRHPDLGAKSSHVETYKLDVINDSGELRV